MKSSEPRIFSSGGIMKTFSQPGVSLLVLISVLIGSLCIQGCKKAEPVNPGQASSKVSIAVFIPGVMAGSAIYEMLADGATKAADDFNAQNPGKEVSVTVIEGGFNQAEWENQITTLSAAGAYDLIVSSNPSLPEIVSSVSIKFPVQKFLLLDGELAGNPSVYTLRYNQREQAYMAGYIAALASLDAAGNDVQTRSAEKRLGLVAGQEYPVMNTIILPGFTDGARAVDPLFTVDFRVVGNWFDAAKGAELAAGMIRSGVRVILPVAGGAGQGVVQAAAEAGAKVIWFDTNGYAIRPGTVIGSAILRQDRAAYEKVMLFLKGELPFGAAEIAGTAAGFVDFIEDDPLYLETVSLSIREKQAELTSALRSGRLKLD